MRITPLLPLSLLTLASSAQWTFNADTTVTWEEAIARYAELDRMHTGARLFTIGNDDDGSPIHLFVMTDGSGFTPDSVRAAGKNILWITNGIHPGEPDGIDASLMLAQALLEDDHLMGLAVHTAICIVPVYNVSGARQLQRPSRPDQNGPTEHGIRGNAKNLDLNRDFIKMDAKNTWAIVQSLARWDPDVYFETHVSDGADHQYVMELVTTQKDKLDPILGAFMTTTMVPELYTWMDRKGRSMCPYFETLKEVPDSGLVEFYDAPRYSTGYNALFDRIGILAESHMLKPYADRVNATFQLMLATLAVMDQHGDQLSGARSSARANTAKAEEFGFNWTLDTTAVAALRFKGYEAGYRPSPVSGLPRLWYDHQRPFEREVPWLDTYRPSLISRKPLAYLVPGQWHEVIERLRANGVEMHTVESIASQRFTSDSLISFNTLDAPFEGHYLHRGIRCTTTIIERRPDAGDMLVPMGRATDRFVMSVLEARTEDGYFAWNFFDAILQQKEWFNPYAFEEIAAERVKNDPVLKKALEEQRVKDPHFAADGFAQLLFIFRRSPWFEEAYRRHPVLRVVR